MKDDKSLLVKRMRLAARVLGFGAMGIGAAFVIYEAVGQFLGQGWVSMEAEVVWFVLILAMALAGCILSWRRERLAAILLISSAAAMAADLYIMVGRERMITWLLFGLPYLIAGLLLLKSWRLSNELRREPR